MVYYTNYSSMVFGGNLNQAAQDGDEECVSLWVTVRLASGGLGCQTQDNEVKVCRVRFGRS